MSNNKSQVDNDKIDNMHVPHLGLLQWNSDTKDEINKSRNDTSSRVFGIRFFLEDLRANTKYVHVNLDENVTYHMSDLDNKFTSWFEKDNHNYLKSILVEITTCTMIDAFKIAAQRIFTTLSVLCFFYRRPFRVYKICIMDDKYNAESHTSYFCSKSEKLTLPLASFSEKSPLGSLLAIYRDGMNSMDIPYRYICFFKIYEAWHKKFEKYFSINKDDKVKIIITYNLVRGFYRENFHQTYLNKSIDDKDVYKDLNEIRRYLVHPVIDMGVPASFINLDHIDALEVVELMSYLIEAIATKILDSQIKEMANENAEIDKILKIYNKISNSNV